MKDKIDYNFNVYLWQIYLNNFLISGEREREKIQMIVIEIDTLFYSVYK